MTFLKGNLNKNWEKDFLKNQQRTAKLSNSENLLEITCKVFLTDEYE